MRTRFLILALVSSMAFTLACGPLSLLQQSSPTATPAPAQPTKPPAAPTTSAPATGVPATAAPAATKPPAAATAAPTTSAPPDFGGLWSDAQKKAKSASRFRMSMSWIVGATENGVYAEEPFIVLEGYTVVTDTYQVFSAGMLNEIMGGTKIEMMEVGGKSYMKGAGFLGLMDPTKWYLMSDSSQSSPPFEPDDMFNMASPGSATGENAARKIGTETLEGQSCDVWAWNFTNSSQLLGFLSDVNSKVDMTVTDKAETKSWLCRDGYVHRVAMEILGHAKDNVNEKGAMKLESRMWDFENPALTIKAPEGALPFGQ